MYGGIHSPRPLPSDDALLTLAREFTPRVEARTPSPVLLDLHGCGRLWPSPTALGDALVSAATARAIEAHVALARSRTTVLVLARARSGLTVVPAGGEAAALAPLPLTLLDLPPEREAILTSWGLRTIGDVARLPARGLAARFGPDGPRLVRLARGEDDGAFVRTPVAESFEMTLELEWPVDGLEPLTFLLGRVLEPLCETLVKRGRKASALAFSFALVDGTTHTRTLAPAMPSAQARTWRTLALLDLEVHPPQDAITRIAVHATPTAARETQFSLLDPAQPSPERLAETLARLGAWTADGRAGAPHVLDTHRPGAFTVGSFAPGPASPPAEPAPATTPRVALRAFRPPLPAQVDLRESRPAYVSAAGVRGAVAACAGPWRASGDWWDVAWSRDEWDVALETGGVFRLFLDRLREAWYVEGELD